MTLDEAVSQFEARFDHIEMGNPSYWSQTSEPYDVVCCGGIKEEGQRIREFFLSQDDAVASWLRAIIEYAEGKSGTLYWRHRPAMEFDMEWSDAPGGPAIRPTDPKQWAVYSRLLISDKPAAQSAEDAA